MPARVDKEKCTGCGACIESCPVNAITIKDNKAEISDSCLECGVCVNQCPTGALSVSE